MTIPSWSAVFSSLSTLVNRVYVALRHVQCAHLLWFPVYCRVRAAPILALTHRPPTDVALNNIPSTPRTSAPKDQILEVWSRYLDSRVTEWQVLLTISCLLVASGPTLLQIPGAGSNPTTRALSILAVFQACFGIINCAMLLFCFKSTDLKVVTHFNTWIQAIEANETATIWTPWTMLALPAATTSWAMIFYISAFINLMWRSADASTSSTAGAAVWTISVISVLSFVTNIFYAVGTATSFSRNAPSIYDEEVAH